MLNILSPDINILNNNILKYIVQDKFSIDQASPLVSPRSATPGPGIYSISDVNNKANIVNNIFTVSSGAGARVSGLFDNTVNISPPLGIVLDIGQTYRTQIEINNTSSLDTLPQFQRDENNLAKINCQYTSGISPYAFSTSSANPVRCGILVYPTNYTLFIVKDGNFGNGVRFKIIFAQVNTQIVRYGHVSNTSGNAAKWNNWNIFGFPKDVPYTNAVTNVNAGGIFTSDANFCITGTHIAQNGVIQDLQFRRVDDNNCLILRCNQTTGKIGIYKNVLGVNTLLGTETNYTFVSGNSYNFALSCQDSRLSYVFNGGASPTIVDTTFQTNNGLKFSHAAANLTIFPEFLKSSSVNLLA